MCTAVILTDGAGMAPCSCTAKGQLHNTRLENVFVSTEVDLSCFHVPGVGGNLVAVQASRISTYLHMNGIPMGDPNPAPRKCPTPCTSFFGSSKLSGSSGINVPLSPPTLYLIQTVFSIRRVYYK